MSFNIHKHKLMPVSTQHIEMRGGADIISVQFQEGILCLWTLAGVGVPNEMREIRIYGTGHMIPTLRNHKYIGTAQNEGLVWHVFDAGVLPNPTKE